MYNIERFIEAQQRDYQTALNEIKNGKKESHWIWYIFPQLKGLGQSEISEYYGIANINEAQEYMLNEYLNQNMHEILTELLKLDDNIFNIMGYPDNLKLLSSMTLFEQSNPEDQIFKQVLDKFYKGQRDNKTLEMLTNKREL